MNQDLYFEQLAKELIDKELINEDIRLVDARKDVIKTFRLDGQETLSQEAENVGIPIGSIEEITSKIAEQCDVLGLDKNLYVPLVEYKAADPALVDIHHREMSRRWLNKAYEVYHYLSTVITVIASRPAVVNKPPKNSEPITYFFSNVDPSENELREIYNRLVWNQWIDDGQTSEDDFVYFFSGVGRPPKKRIRWKESGVLLSFFVKRICNDTRIWKLCSEVFELRDNSLQFRPVDGKKLNVTYYSASQREVHLTDTNAVDKILQL